MNQLITKDVKMTSLDIAKIVGKEHKNVLRDIRNEIEALGDEMGQLIFEPTERRDSQNRMQLLFTFGKQGAMQLALKYDAKTRYNVIQYVDRLENKPRVLTEKEQLKASMRLSLETSEEVEEIKKDVIYLKGNMRIDSLQQQDMQKAARISIVRALGGKESPAYASISKKAFPALWNEFKDHFKVPRYPDLPKMKFDEAMNFINLWRPSTSLQIRIDNCNSQMAFDVGQQL